MSIFKLQFSDFSFFSNDDSFCFGSFDSIRGIFFSLLSFFRLFFQMKNLYPVYDVRVCISSIIRVCLVYGSSTKKTLSFPLMMKCNSIFQCFFLIKKMILSNNRWSCWITDDDDNCLVGLFDCCILHLIAACVSIRLVVCVVGQTFNKNC